MAMGRCQGEGRPAREAPFGVRKRGWIPAPSSRGQALRGKNGWGALGLRGGRFSNRPYGREGYA